ncbi:MAG: translation initiation factor IF-3 [Candidatus Sungbacteria bacterium RIFCSPLOWO2_12_FULL_41_11]|uniref:Translation initiation factor IF-3 n=1 Tax=Candidatus Sungbacteria bacterium RIFCSPLOWO2_12_FULL_41_11 TaxID=1802286 RepID=A0A1G2LRK0_9BACT|nr:MAG: translation initiation factor IF-3 [Candidatus Sungbacteria bacterium RIFCSPHIGHO2_02_FULL_41_12b]OHA14124.1 MAG: translation initiation factor IF-3 [Candidatus Sungbacteria bacterium RIFCSPLOWO2_12_FULL_41_11]
MQKRYRTNQYIRISPVQVIDESGKNLGVMDTYEALRIAQERGLDLIEIAPTVRPPVCKIMDFGKFKYQREKGEREHGKKQKETEIKSLRIGFTTGKHDLELRAKQAEKFLAEGDKVKIDMILRGREKSLRDFAQKKFGQFLEMIPEKELEQALKRTPQGFIAIIKPQIKTRISHE